MTRLIAFGCSITYGAGLPDCIVDDGYPGPEPSVYAWPSCLGSLLGKDVINNSAPGSSNLQILNSILNFKFSKDDQVVIMWSYIDRDMIFTNDGVRPLGAWQTDSLSKHWLALHNPTDKAIRTWYNIHHASLYLKNLGLEYHNFIVYLEPIIKFKPDWFDDVIHDIDVQRIKTIDLAGDNMHPGVNAHKEIARCIGNRINEY